MFNKHIIKMYNGLIKSYVVCYVTHSSFHKHLLKALLMLIYKDLHIKHYQRFIFFKLGLHFPIPI